MKLLTFKVVIGLFIAVVAIFFYQTILRGRMPVPTDALVGLYHPWRDLYAHTNPRGVTFKNFLITDPVRQQIPWRKIVIDQWKSGRIPSYNPYSFSGTSLIGNIQAGVFYPMNILFFFMPFPSAWTALIILQPVLAGIFMLAYLAHRKYSPLASLLGAVTFAFSGFAISWLTWGTIVHVALWLPLALLAIDRQKPWILAWALSMMVLAGHLQIALYTIALAFLYALFEKRASFFSRVWVFVTALTMPAWAPTVAQGLQSGRVTAGTWRVAEGWFIPIKHLVQFVAPDFFGNPATLNYWGTWNYGEMVGYIGIAPLVFAVFSIMRPKERWNRFWIVAGGISLLFALATPVGALPYVVGVPLISSLQPTRLLVVVTFSLIMLAVSGFDAWQKKERGIWMPTVLLGMVLGVLWAVSYVIPHLDPDLATNFAIARRNLILPSVLFLAFVGFAFARRVRPVFAGIAAGGIVLLAVFDLLRFGWKFTPFSPQEYFFPTSGVIRYLQAQPKPFRVMSVDERILPPNTAAYFGIESIEGYDPLYLTRYEQLFRTVALGQVTQTQTTGTRILTMHNIDSPYLPFLNVKYVLSLADIDSSLVREVFREGEVRVYEYLAALPRVYLAENLRLADDLSSDPTVTTVELPIEVLSLPLVASETVELASYSDGHMSVRAFAVNPRVLVFLTPFDPVWRVSVNGKPADTIRVNYAFAGVVIPPGENLVEFRYAP